MNEQTLTYPCLVSELAASADRLFTILDRFNQIQVLVIGDLALDEFLTGSVERISREAPVLILRHESTQQIPGGGANAAYNLMALGAKVKVAGLVGKDSQGEALRGILAVGSDTKGILLDSDRPTVTKTRISGHARQSVTQQIVRVDRKSEEIPAPILQSQLAEYIQQQLATVDAVVCSDYGDGVFSAAVIQAALSHSQVIVDAQTDLHRYRGATLLTPNIPEVEKAVGYPIEDERSLQKAAQDLFNLTQAEKLLITRGEEGMSLFEQEESKLKTWHIPAFNRTKVFDVTGAGDTVVAILTLSLCAGASFWEAAVLSNLAASIVVRRFGTATTTVEEIKEALPTLLETSEGV